MEFCSYDKMGWAKEAKCQGIAGSFTVIEIEMEELHVLLLTTLEGTSSPVPK